MTATIEKVEAVLLSVPRNAGFSPAQVLLMQIHSSDGVRGIGSCQYEFRYGEAASEALGLVQNYYAPLLLKENPFEIETILTKLDRFIPGHLASKATIDIALHDLK